MCLRGPIQQLDLHAGPKLVPAWSDVFLLHHVDGHHWDPLYCGTLGPYFNT